MLRPTVRLLVGFVVAASACGDPLPGAPDVESPRADGAVRMASAEPDVAPATLPPPRPRVVCSSCLAEEDCGPAHHCTQLGATLRCLPPCSLDADCPSGWPCRHASPEVAVCVPPDLRCAAPCLLTGCASWLTCNPEDPDDGGHPVAAGTCVRRVPTCGDCERDWECGAGARCVSPYGGFRYCLRECESDADCPSWGACHALVEEGHRGVQACVPWDPSNCGNRGEVCDSGCFGATPLCYRGECVQCLANDHCARFGGICDPTQGLRCVGGICEDWPRQPFPCPDRLGECCECVVDGDCGLDGMCGAEGRCEWPVCSDPASSEPPCVEPPPAP